MLSHVENVMNTSAASEGENTGRGPSAITAARSVSVCLESFQTPQATTLEPFLVMLQTYEVCKSVCSIVYSYHKL